MTFADRLKELRIEKKLSLNDIAEYLGIQRATIYKYEHGLITNIPPARIHKLATLFGVTRPYLMGWTDERGINPGFNLDMVADKLREEKTNRSKSKWKPSKSKDCITPATQALRALTKFKISRTPIYTHQIIQESMLATMITFGDEMQIPEKGSMPLAMIAEFKPDGKSHYLFQVSNDAPIGKTNLTLAVELGHIYLGHDEDHIKEKEELSAQCFAIHLLFPRPVIKLLQEKGFVFTYRTFSMIFGFCDWCLGGILNADPVSVSPELNRLVKEQFVPYIDMMDKLGLLNRRIYDGEEILDMSKYMTGYEE